MGMLIKHSNPKYSILTSTWNRKDTLPNVVQSLDRQIFKNFEWIVADDGSVDGTLAYLEKIKTEASFDLKIISSSVRQGKAVMDNLAVLHSSGDYLIWCDSDDILEEDALQVITDALDSPCINNNVVGILAFTNFTRTLKVSEGTHVDQVFKRVTFSELYTEKPFAGDMLLCVDRWYFGDRRFPEVDFVYPEGGLWSSFVDAEFLIIPRVLQKKSYSSKNRISFSGKMEYSRGRAYSLAHTYRNLGFSSHSIWRRLMLQVLFIRYGIHGDIKLRGLWNMWEDRGLRKFFFLAIIFAFIFVVKDRLQRKVVRTHVEFERSRKLTIQTKIY